ncbi:hypothetical protein HAX54_043961 [Datura stramonium]|uniref:Uncharacterized protein n=1 Tax=Datura stramonium TaxID=4076 RepID=A0ABS8W6B8_DATST|nr:hypothetical protein [Datura stramonium]
MSVRVNARKHGLSCPILFGGISKDCFHPSHRVGNFSGWNSVRPPPLSIKSFESKDDLRDRPSIEIEDVKFLGSSDRDSDGSSLEAMILQFLSPWVFNTISTSWAIQF